MLLIVILVQRRLILLAAEKHLGYQEWPENGYQPHDALIADCSATSSFPALLPLVIVAYRHKKVLPCENQQAEPRQVHKAQSQGYQPQDGGSQRKQFPQYLSANL